MCKTIVGVSGVAGTRNLATGAGFSYNPGIPVAGSTAPLWTLVLGAGAVVATASLAMAKVIGVVATLVTALVIRRAAISWGARSSRGSRCQGGRLNAGRRWRRASRLNA